MKVFELSVSECLLSATSNFKTSSKQLQKIASSSVYKDCFLCQYHGFCFQEVIRPKRLTSKTYVGDLHGVFGSSYSAAIVSIVYRVCLNQFEGHEFLTILLFNVAKSHADDRELALVNSAEF